MVQICCSAEVANSENVVDQTAESFCHSRLLRRKQEAYVSWCRCQVHAAIAPMQSLLRYSKQRNTDVGVGQTNEQFNIDISRNSVQCGLSSRMEPNTTILTRSYRQPEWSRGIWKSHRDNRTSSVHVSVLRRHKQNKLIFRSVNWNHLQAL